MHHVSRTVVGALLVGVATASAPALAQGPVGKLFAMEVLGVQADPQSGAPTVVLRGTEDKRELTMYIGQAEAQAIATPLQRLRPARPLTHDLLLAAITGLRATVRRAVITGLRESTYTAELILEAQGREISLDARPSDAIAVALRADAPILAAEAVFVRSRPAGSGAP
jgi:bifunctional DNase/RNase